MVRYALRATPWGRTLAAAVLVVALMEVVRRWPGPTGALIATAVGLLAGAAAWSLDEPAAAVVDASPRSLAWRTLSRCLSSVLLGLVWCLCVARARTPLEGHAVAVGAQGLVAIMAGLGWTAWRRSGGDATPGGRFAAAVVPGTTAWVLTQSWHKVMLFPAVYAGADDWARGRQLWTVVGGCAVVLFVAALVDGRWWLARHHPVVAVGTWGTRPN